jgi:hypothetical protein
MTSVSSKGKTEILNIHNKWIDDILLIGFIKRLQKYQEYNFYDY